MVNGYAHNFTANQTADCKELWAINMVEDNGLHLKHLERVI